MAITTDLLGGLGNYMFQIATTHSLAIDNSDVAVYDSNGVIKIHNHLDTYKTNILRNLIYRPVTVDTHYSEPHFSYNKITYEENLKIMGYFQSEKYFQHNRDSILDLFSVDSDSDIYIKEKFNPAPNFFFISI